MTTCTLCKSDFLITNEDRAYYEKISPVFNEKKYQIPEPTLCPPCRRQRRLVWRNEWKLYHRSCDLCQEKIISMYRPEAPFPVYCLDCWWGDDWDPYQYGQDFDFSRPFFEQFEELRNKSPHFSLAVQRSTMVNSDFCNHAGSLKNCYLIVNSDMSEQCLLGKAYLYCFDCIDCFTVYKCEGCYQAINCSNSTFCHYIIDSHTCSNCYFSSNLTGCKNCFGCVNLRNKEYYFFNEKLSPEEYEKRVSAIKSEKTDQQIWEEFLKFRTTQPHKWMQEKNTENCTGDYLAQAKDCVECYDSEFIENCKYCNGLKEGDKVSFDNYDISYFGMGVESSYESSVAGYNDNHIAFCENVWESYDVFYSQLCMNNSHDLFGCMSLKHGKYAIFNKQYSKEEYESLAAKIIEHMQETGEYGEFFPHTMTPYGYSESSAQEYFPMTKQEVLEKGWNWYDEKEPDYSGVSRTIESERLPDFAGNIPDEILNWAIKCQETGRLFKIQRLELEFYRKFALPVPKFHPDIRHRRRFLLRHPQNLYKRNCDKCQKDIETSFHPDSPEKVYCHECYLGVLD